MFVVQKHKATALHYDLRIEIDGVFKSWAVPKGPTLAPGDQRLAVFVEDHPLAYGSFEGIIPKGNYGAGTVMVWDRGTVIERGSKGREDSNVALREGLEAGHLTFLLDGTKLRGEFALIQLRGKDPKAWLLVKKRDEHSTFKPIGGDDLSVATGRTMAEITANAASKGEVWLPRGKGKARERVLPVPPPAATVAPVETIPRTLKPMLPVVAALPLGVDGWLFQSMRGGKRCLASIEKSGVKLTSWQGLSFNAKFPELVMALAKLPAPLMLDGEIDEHTYWLLDILHQDGRNLRALALKDRVSVLASLDLSGLQGVRLAMPTREPPVEVDVTLARHEAAAYEPGTSPFWIKYEKRKEGEGPRVHFTHTDKLYWPTEGYTKGDLIAYYQTMAPYVLPYMLEKAQSLHRHPDGVERAGFFHKDMQGSLPSWIKTTRVESQGAGKTIDFLICNDQPTLLFMANLGCIELNPWLSRADRPEHPDWCVIDLDPDGQSYEEIMNVALAVGETLDQVKIPAFVKTSGADGMHIYVPLNGQIDFDASRDMALAVAEKVTARFPSITTLERNPSKRRGRMYVDCHQNRRGQTIASAYCLRPRPGATASAPLSWDELKPGLDPKAFTIKTMPERVARKGDLWKAMLAVEPDAEAWLARLGVSRLGVKQP